MDKILLNGLSFYGYHGVLQEEQRLGQKFFIDIELILDLIEAGKSDDLSKSVSYADVFDVVKEIVEGKPFKLIEALAEAISSRIFKDFTQVSEVVIKIKKPEAPVPGVYNYFGVEIHRSKNGESLS